jgi:hypothetical protein
VQGTSTPTLASVTYAKVKDALAAAGGAVTTVAGAVVALLNDLKAVKTPGVTLEDAQASDATNTVQLPPVVLWKGHVRVSGTDRTMQARVSVVPRTTGAIDIVFEYDLGAGGGFSEAFKFTTSTAASFVAALYTTSSILIAGQTIGFDVDQSGIWYSGGLQLRSLAAAGLMVIRSSTTPGAGPAIRIQGSGGDWSASQIVVQLADGSSGSPVALLNVMGDGSLQLQRLALLVDTSTTLNVVAVDTGKLITTNNANPVTVNLPAGSPGLWFRFKNKGAGSATLTPAGSEKLFTTSQVASLVLATGDAALIAWESTDWCVLS